MTENRNPGGAPADLVLKNGDIRTFSDPARARAAAVKGGRLVWLGDDPTAAAWIGPETKVLDLGGRLALPAFVDAHMHPPAGAFRYVYCLSLFGVNAEDMIGAYLDRAAEFARAHPEFQWIQGAGFRRAVFDGVGPRREWLDKIDSRRPISIVSRDGHSMWCNSRALEMAGIDADTPDPPNGVIKRDPQTGAPAGLLLEAAMDLVRPLVPKPEKEEIKKSLLWLQEWLNREGITTAHDAMLEPDEPRVWEAYQELAREGRLTVRYRASWRMYPDRDFRSDIDRALEISKGFDTPWFQARSFKFFADEVVEEETAYLLEPYRHRDDNWRGLKDWADEELAEAFTRIYRGGGQVHIHTIGDGAVRYTLDALEAAARAAGPGDRRPNLAHLQLAAASDIGRMADLGATAVVSPYWAAIEDYFWELFVPYLGRDRAFNDQYPLKSFFEAGVNTAVHSDFSVTEPDMMRAVYSGLTRRMPRRVFEARFGRIPKWRWVPEDGDALAPGGFGKMPPDRERLSLEEILGAASAGGAYANFLEDDLGTMAPGKLADLIVFDRNLFEIDVEEIPEAKVVLTLFEGRVVHKAAELG